MRLLVNDSFCIFHKTFEMTLLEKKKSLKKAIESLSDDQVDEALYLIEKVISQDEKRKMYVKDVLNKEKNLFDRLAQ